jgi:hypothetical protein
VVDALEPAAQPRKRGRKPGGFNQPRLDWRAIAHNNLEAQRNTLLLQIGEEMCEGTAVEHVQTLIYRAIALKTALDAVSAIPDS